MAKLAVGRYLAYLRERAGLTQAEAAAVIGKKLPDRGLSTRMMNYYETGVNYPGVEVLLAFAEVIGGSLEDIQWLATNAFEDEAEEGLSKARAWYGSKRAERLSAAADEAARIVETLRESGETSLAEQYLGVGRRLLRRTA